MHNVWKLMCQRMDLFLQQSNADNVLSNAADIECKTSNCTYTHITLAAFDAVAQTPTEHINHIKQFQNIWLVPPDLFADVRKCIRMIGECDASNTSTWIFSPWDFHSAMILITLVMVWHDALFGGLLPTPLQMSLRLIVFFMLNESDAI